MELNEWDYENLEGIVKILERYTYNQHAKNLTMIIRKIKRVK